MKYSLAIVAFLGIFALQCSARPQPQVDVSTPSSTEVSSSPATGEGALTDIGTGSTDAPVAGEQVVFDENQSAGSQDAESADSGVTTDAPEALSSDDESQDVATTITPESASAVLTIDEIVPMAGESADAPQAPSEDESESEAMNTTQSPSSE